MVPTITIAMRAIITNRIRKMRRTGETPSLVSLDETVVFVVLIVFVNIDLLG